MTPISLRNYWVIFLGNLDVNGTKTILDTTELKNNYLIGKVIVNLRRGIIEEGLMKKYLIDYFIYLNNILNKSRRPHKISSKKTQKI